MIYLTLLLLTILMEIVVYLIFFRKNFKKVLLYCILINAFTWPLAMLFYGLTNFFILTEILVFLTEIYLIKILFGIKLEKAFVLSLIANLITATITFVVGKIFII